MAITANKIVTFTDLKYMIDNEGFVENNSFSYTSLKCPDKLEIIDAINVDNSAGTDMAGYANLRCCPREVLIPSGVSNVFDLFILGDGTTQNITSGYTYELTYSGLDYFDFLWSTGEATRSIFVTPTSDTIFHLTKSDGGSIDVDTITLNVP